MAKTTKKKTTKKSEKVQPHSALFYRNHANTVRAWQYFAGGEAIIIVLLVFAIVTMLPLKEVEVKYVEFSRSNDNYFEVLPSNIPKTTAQAMVRSQLRNYVYNRERRDGATEVERFRRVQAMSDQSVFAAFRDMYNKTKDNFEGIQRNIEIVSDSEISPGIHQVEYIAEDVKDGMGRERSYFAIVTYEVLPHVVNEEGALLNPMGLNVTKYVISQREGVR